MFQIPFAGPNGDTFTCDDVKAHAYRYAAYVVNVLGRRYRMTIHVDGSISVAADGLETLTFRTERILRFDAAAAKR